jgi:glutamate/tyrosine decarboxylase-like PLP-dependent enzyme
VQSLLGSRPVVIVPETHHYCFEKALDLLGLGRRSLVSVRVDSDFRMRPDHLERTLDEIDARGDHVLALVAVVGSTEEGSVDPVDAIVALRKSREEAGKPSFWIHADGAYGGYLRTVTIPDRVGLGEPRTRVRIAGVEREIPLELPEHSACRALETLRECDSVTIDPHKLGYIPYPAGAICFRSNLVKSLARQEAPYLEEESVSVEADRRSEAVGVYVLEGSKPGAAAAAVWLSHSLIPLDNTGHGILIRDTIRHACELHAMLEHWPEYQPGRGVRAVCLCAPGSNIVCYAFRPAGADASLESINRLNRAVHERFSLQPGERVYDQRFLVSRTTLSSRQYAPETVRGFLERLGVSEQAYREQGVFLMRSVMMNPWYGQAKEHGRHVIAELVEELYAAAETLKHA